MAFKLLLLEWGLSSFLENFEEESIDDDSFSLIDDETINKIFAKSGPKLIFKNKLRTYLEEKNKKESEEINAISSQVDRPSLTPDSNPEANSSITDVLEASASTSNTYIFEADEDFMKHLNENVESHSESHTKRPLTENSVNEPSTKKPCTSVFSQSLQDFLQQTMDGKIVLMNRQKLNNDYRQKLVKLVINEIIKKYGNDIKPSVFLRAADEIGTFFPNERSETYYIPYERKKCSEKKGIPPRGKLWSRYMYLRQALRCAAPNSSTSEINLSDETTEHEETYLTYLKCNTEPFTKILEAWEVTYKRRKKLALNESLENVLNEFPCLKLNSGLVLIETDFNRKFPEKIDAIYVKWPTIRDAIIKEAKERKVNAVDCCDTSLQALLILPYLFSPFMIKKSRKGESWRPSRSEVSESFFLHVESLDEVGEKIARRRERLKQFDLTLQPFGVVVGALRNPDGFLVVFKFNTIFCCHFELKLT